VSEFFINSKHNLPSIDDRLDSFIRYLFKGEKYEILEKHGGGKLITDKYLKLYEDRMLGIGDSVSSLNPFWGEGIRQGLFSAKFAVDSIIKDRIDGKGLQDYAKKMNQYHDLNWKISMFISKQIYTRPNQVVFEKMIEYMDKYLTGEEVVAIGFQYDFKTLFFKKPVEFLKIALRQIFH
jgi:flavin-dependent dehydrogenase